MEKRLGYSVIRNFDYSQPFAEGVVNRGRIEHPSSYILSKTCLDIFLPSSDDQTAALESSTASHHTIHRDCEDGNSGAASKSSRSSLDSAGGGGKTDVNKSKEQTIKEGNLHAETSQNNSHTMKDDGMESSASSCTNESTTTAGDDVMRRDESVKNRNINGGKSERPPPLVVFAYGGGWRRGDKQTWRHYISRWECNFSLAAMVGCDRLYSNIGESFASRGFPCAVLSYPIAPTPFLLNLSEMAISLSYALAYNILAALFLFFMLEVVLPKSWVWGEGHSILSLSAGVIIVAQWITLAIMFSREMNLDKRHKTDTEKGISRKMPIVIALIAILATVSMLDVYTLAENNTLTVSVSGIFLFAVQCLIYYFRQTTSLELGQSLVAGPKGQAESVARALRWLVDYGRSTGQFDPDSIILMGHSAGGHLVSLVTLDHHYLKDVGIPPQSIKGVITLSAVHDLQSISKGFLYHIYLKPAFGTDPAYWTTMSPIQYVKVLDENKDLTPHSSQLSLSSPLPVSSSAPSSSSKSSSSSQQEATSSLTSSSLSSSSSSSPQEATSSSTSMPLAKSPSSPPSPSQTAAAASSSSSSTTPTSSSHHRPNFLIISAAQDFEFMIKDAERMNSILNKNGYVTKRGSIQGCSHFNMVRKFGCPWYRYWTGVFAKNGGWVPSDGELICWEFVQQFWSKE